VVLTSAQILALFTTPIQIVPAPAAGFHINPVKAVLRTNPGATPYASGGIIQLALGASAGAVIGTIAAATIITATTAQVSTLIPNTWTTSKVLSDAQPLVVNNATGAFITGNGTLSITVYYTVEPTK
jgi:hypothetical protein